MPTLCIPRRKSILIETIHHSRRPMDELLFLRLRRGSPGLCSWDPKPRSRSLGSDRVLLVVVPLSTQLPSRFNFTGFRGISGLRMVGFGLSPLRPPALFLASFFFLTSPWNYSPAFAEFEVGATRAFYSLDDIAFRLCLWNLWSVTNFD